MDEELLEQVYHDNDLRKITEKNGKIRREIWERIGKVGKLYNALPNAFLEKKVPLEVKIEV